jgi:hypothetical protein
MALDDYTTDELKAEIERRRVTLFGSEARLILKDERGSWHEVPCPFLFPRETPIVAVNTDAVLKTINRMAYG